MGGGERGTNGDEKESVEGSWEKKKRERERELIDMDSSVVMLWGHGDGWR